MNLIANYCNRSSSMKIAALRALGRARLDIARAVPDPKTARCAMPATLSGLRKRLVANRGRHSLQLGFEYHSSGGVTGVTVYTFHYIRAQMTTTLSVRIDRDTKDQLEALAKRARRSKSFLAAEAIAAYVEAERWQLDEIQAGLQELDKGRAVAHKSVSKWLRSWGKKRERKAPRA